MVVIQASFGGHRRNLLKAQRALESTVEWFGLWVGGGVEVVVERRRVVVAQQVQPFSGFPTSIAGAASNRVIVASHSVMVCIQGIGGFRRERYPISDLIDARQAGWKPAIGVGRV
jgi:hypothetical protein